MSEPFFDLVRFAADALTTHGALVEPDGGHALAVLPSTLAQRFGVSESVELQAQVGGTGVACVLGSRLIDDLVAERRGQPAMLWLRVDGEPPRIAQARALAARFVVRNGVFDVIDARVGRAPYLSLVAGYRAEADDRHDGLLRLAVQVQDGAAADALDTVDFEHIDNARVLTQPAFSLDDGAVALRVFSPRVAAAVTHRIAHFAAQVQRRHARDHQRIAQYFDELVQEARKSKRTKDIATLEAKLAHLIAERDKKLLDLSPRFAIRVTAHLALLVGMDLPVAQVDVRIRRRKAERVLTLRLHALGRALDRPTCESCLLPTGNPAVCDDALHLLCEVCVPQVQGRIPCPVCRT